VIDANGQLGTVDGVGDLGNGGTAVGSGAFANNTGDNNSALGFNALYSNTAGNYNTATGNNALASNTEGNDNTAIGAQALFNNTTGAYNTGMGAGTLQNNTDGEQNTATGFLALFSNMSGNGNVADGYYSLWGNMTGSFNTAIGRFALNQNTTGTGNIAVGEGAGGQLTTGDNNIDIGNFGVAGESHTIRIGAPDCACGPGGSVGGQTATFIAGIYGATTSDAGTTIPVYVDMNGNLGTAASSVRFKKEIRPMDKASEAVLGLKPVSFQYKSDNTGRPQFGLIAEEVAKVNPDLVVRDRKGEIYSVRYEAVNAMLLNEFLKAHQRIEEQDKRIDQLTAQLKEQAALIQKVNDKVELNRPAPQTVANEQ
jgi:hypothetical protein